jgi:CspA family cold shock protein
MIKGTVKFFNGTKGFGFITPDDGSKEVFVPTATVTASGAGPLKAGQRVSFEAEQEARGPKAVKLTLLDEPLREVAVREVAREPARDVGREAPREPARASVTLYYEADDEDAADVSAALSAAGISARQIDYVVTPPPREELKKLSVMLRDANQSLARRYDSLFMELQLDDRFISEAEFLTGIFEHPTLINGPIVVAQGKARVCRTAEEVQAFLSNGGVEEKRPKGISPRMAAMMLGEAVPPPAPVKVVEKPQAPVAVLEKAEAPEKTVTKIKLEPRARKVAAEVKAPAAAKVVAKPVKAKAPAKPFKKATKK